MDTIRRSGAVEQLRVHVRNLSMLGVNGATDSKGRVELYEKGYGKDAAGIAREAISYGKPLISLHNRSLRQPNVMVFLDSKGPRL
jgi:signal recognition particle GTPase